MSYIVNSYLELRNIGILKQSIYLFIHLFEHQCVPMLTLYHTVVKQLFRLGLLKIAKHKFAQNSIRLFFGILFPNFYTENEDIVKILIEHDADVNVVDADNNTALTYAIRKGIQFTEKKRAEIFI